MLAVHHYACSSAQPLIAAPLVLLHGWGRDSSSWLPLVPELQKFTSVIAIDLPGFGASAALDDYRLDAVLALIAAQLPAQAVLMGWSLGGMLAVQLAARLPQRILGLVTLAANLRFVSSRDYPSAMPASTNRQFMRAFTTEPQAALKMFGCLMMQGALHERQLLKQWRALPELATNPAWLAALELLAQLDNRPAFRQLDQPGLHIFAEQDALVPAAAVATLRELNAQQQVELVPACAHAIHWSQPQPLLALLMGYLSNLAEKNPQPIAKQKIAQSFSRAAKTYDAVAGLQRAVGETLLGYLPAELAAGATILDLGSGTGYFTRQLAQRFSAQHLVGLDIAQGMLQHAQQTTAASPIAGQPIQWLCGDAELLPLADCSMDMIFSSLAIQWCNQLPQLMGELYRCLKPGGRLFIATLGPQTLHELKSAWQQVDNYVHVNRFQPAAAVQAAAAASGFVCCELKQELRVLQFERLVDLTRELKALGAHNMNSGKPGGLTGRARIEAFKVAYEQYRGAQGLPASYAVIYFSAQKSLESL